MCEFLNTSTIYLQNTPKTDFYYLSRFQKSILLLKISLKMILRISPLVLRNQPKSVISIICRSWSLRMTLHELYRSRPISVNFHLCKNHRHTFSHSCFGSIPKVKPIWYSWLLKEEKSVLANFASLWTSLWHVTNLPVSPLRFFTNAKSFKIVSWVCH